MNRYLWKNRATIVKAKDMNSYKRRTIEGEVKMSRDKRRGIRLGDKEINK